MYVRACLRAVYRALFPDSANPNRERQLRSNSFIFLSSHFDETSLLGSISTP